MPRYHFNVYDAVETVDRFGEELPDIIQARRAAIRFGASLLEDGGTKDSLSQEFRMEVTDNDGLVLFRLGFIVTDAPAVERIEAPQQPMVQRHLA